MKRIIAALAFVAVPAIAGAQATASPTAAIATAITVKSAVTLSSGADLDFGIVIPGATAGVTAKGVTTSGGSAGSVLLSANQAVTISAVFSDLTAAGMPNLPVTSTSCGTDTATVPGTTTTLFTCATGTSTAATGVSGLRIFLGGTVATTTTTPAGAYAGTATVTGTYTVY